ncbi:TlpA disulfide reductase family protein [Acinetobacter baumannii]|uniref:TlpA disulfide reductase family protein n=1 Tax=Acinetobacter baumannii TaxID=470 RepID=UPI0004F525A0|nr:TlpA disulfide reductase family protein [Acinetobacter baumannii]EHU1481807.1 TlpA family protein disulfide reductase [Acinetobacter baumannii]EHU2702206.1 TlpA family protein disulfide reductase [Acinetobacter baumannii]EIB6895179.1 TlpA family protein disulfide reductase [Acinetobacter baumannii]EKV0481161.1 TlpA family protein disulfide reductase [Acinetobacter baumannii]EKW6894733.1 TlpA family protein disulfide reductase [Acinetobacter baumannii]
MISAQALHLSIFILPWSLLILFTGLMGVLFIGKYFKQHDQWSDDIWQAYKDSLWTALWIGLISARLTFVLIHADLYLAHPVDILKVQDKGFNLNVGIIIGSGWFILRNRSLKIPVLVCCFLSFITIQFGGINLLNYWNAQQFYPDLVFNDFKQQPQSLTQFIGKPTVVNLWASWCPPCHREMPVLYQAQQDYPGVQFIMLNQGETPEAITNYLHRYHLNFKNVWFDTNGQMVQHMNMYGLPSTLFFNAQGKLIDRHLGELSQAMLQQYLQKITNPSN